MSLGARLALSYLAVILIGMGAIASLAWLGVERLYQNTQSASLMAQAKLVAAALAEQPPVTADPAPYAQTSNLQPGIHTRVIDPQGGAVIELSASGAPVAGGGLALPQLAQNAAGLVTAEELLSRPEIARALAGEAATAIRRVDVAGGGRVLYAAAPVISSAGAVRQIVYLATPLPDTGWLALPLDVRWQFVGVFLAAAMLAGAVGIFLARRISGPLGQLAGAARAVAGGDLGQAVPEDRAIPELDVLGRSFNSMTASLRQADQLKTAFISDVTHELRTPLTVIKGTIETLQDGALDDLEARGPFLESMSRETDRLIRLVNDLLVLTRADAGALNLRPRLLDLAELARARCNHLQGTADKRQVRLRVLAENQAASPESFTVSADADRMAQVLDNLLDNAVRYSPPGGEVRVTLAREGDEVVCQVVDQGAGIPAQHLPYLFERFYRVETSRERGREGGSGLGLSIVRGLVQAHGGNVSAESVVGQGTTITTRLKAASG
jgi:signal transduction histidine kinase